MLFQVAKDLCSELKLSEKLLKGYKKIFVKAGECVEAEIRINKNDLKFYNPDSKSWYLEDNYTFYIGQNSQDIMKIS